MNNITRYSLTLFFLFLSIFIPVIYYKYNSLPWIFWFCNNVSILLALGIFLKNRTIITGELLLGGIGQLFWIIDFITKYFFGIYTTGVTEYMFIPNYPKILFTTGLTHFAIFFLMIWSLHLLGGPAKDGWKVAAIHGILIWAVAFFVFTEQYNLNCAYKSCVSFLPEYGYKIYWPILYLFGVIMPLNYLLNKYWKQKKHVN
ncbi:hypothetical protein HYV79_00965 [Candidatus Woesearchaeota archaeon]|nr:hypothetical protein [Candidatus Woesearchaeota archaeon]